MPKYVVTRTVVMTHTVTAANRDDAEALVRKMPHDVLAAVAEIDVEHEAYEIEEG